MSIKRTIKDVAKTTGVLALAGIAGGGLGFLAFDIINNYHANKTEGVPLIVAGVHIKKGNHIFVATDQFYEMLSYETSEQEQLNAVNGISAAVDALDKFNSQLNYTFCTTSDAMATKFNIPKIDKFGKQDIPLYITEEIIDNNEYVMAKTDWDKKNGFTYEMENISITYRKKYLTAVLNEYTTKSEMFNVKNLTSYILTAHEGIHGQGIRHIDPKTERISIMNPSFSYYKYKYADFYQEDIKMLDDFNVKCYGAEPTYSPDKYPEYKSVNDIKIKETSTSADIKNTFVSYSNIDYEPEM